MRVISGQEITIKSQAILNRRVKLVGTKNRLVAAPTQLPGQIGILDKQAESISQLLWLLWFNKQTIKTLLNYVLAAAYARCDAGKSAGHSLKKRVGHAFPTRWQHKAPGILQKLWNIMARPQKLNALPNSWLGRQLLQFCSTRAIAHQVEPGLQA